MATIDVAVINIETPASLYSYAHQIWVKRGRYPLIQEKNIEMEFLEINHHGAVNGGTGSYHELRPSGPNSF